MSRADAVLLTPVWPARTGGGLAMRAGVLLEGLARRHRVRVVVAPVLAQAPLEDDLVRTHAHDVHVLDLEADADDARARVIALLATPGARERAAALPPLPRTARRLGPAAHTVAELANGANLVWTLRLYLAPLLDGLLDAGAATPRLALDVDDLDATVARRLGDPDEAAAYDRLATYYLPRVALVTAAAHADADALAAAHGLHRAVAVPNAVAVPPLLVDEPIAHDLLFVGNLAYAPNAEAAHWIATELRDRLGDGIRIAIVGRDPSPALRALGERDGVTVAADVPDVAPYYARSAVAIAPLTAGGGTRIKLLEALAHGRPTVATAIAAEGLSLTAQDGVVRAERAGFAAACRALLDDPGRATRLGQAGRAAVREQASVPVVTAAIDALARSMLRP